MSSFGAPLSFRSRPLSDVGKVCFAAHVAPANLSFDDGGRSMKTSTAFAALALAVLGTPCWAAGPNFHQKPYDEVRADLIREGFSPLKFRPSQDLFCKGYSLCEHYPELIRCSGVSTNPCLFAFQKGKTGETMIVITSGETRFTAQLVRPAEPSELEMINDRLHPRR